MGAGISTTIPADKLPAYLPPPRNSPAGYFPPPRNSPAGYFPPPAMTTTTAAAATPATASRVVAFHSPARWRAYFESTKSSNKLIVVKFTASWCGPCKLIEPAFNQLSADYTDVDFVKIDVDELMNASREFGVHAMPTFVLMRKGREVDRVVGVKKEELQMKIEKHRVDDDDDNPRKGYNNYGYY